MVTSGISRLYLDVRFSCLGPHHHVRKLVSVTEVVLSHGMCFAARGKPVPVAMVRGPVYGASVQYTTSPGVWAQSLHNPVSYGPSAQLSASNNYLLEQLSIGTIAMSQQLLTLVTDQSAKAREDWRTILSAWLKQ